MSAEAPKFETLNLRFRATEDEPTNTLPGGWLPWTIGGLLGGVVISTISFWMVRSDLTQALSSDDPGLAFVALDSLGQLESNSARSIMPGVKNPNYEIASASIKTLQGILDHQVENDSDEVVMGTLQLLLGLPEDTPADNRALVRDTLQEFAQKHSPAEESFQQSFALVTNYLAENPAIALPAESSIADDTSLPEVVTDQPTARIAIADSVPPPLDPEADVEQLPNSTSYSLSDSSAEDEPQRIASQAPTAAPMPSRMPNLMQGQTTNAQLESSYPPQNSLANTSPNYISGAPEATTLAERIPQHARQTISRQTNYPYTDSQPDLVGSAEPLGGQPEVAKSPGSRMSLSENHAVGGLETRTERQIVKLLASGNGDWRKAAVLELRKRGWSDTHLQLASELATGSEIRRRELVELISRSMDMNPKFWLLWMAEAGEPSVRRLSVSLLSSMLDSDVERALRIIAMRESDRSVRETISRTLMANATRISAR